MTRLRELLKRPAVRYGLVAGAVVGIVVVVAGLFAAVRLVRTADDLRRAERLLDETAALVEQGHIAEGQERLARAADILTAANSSLYNRVEFDLVEWLPPVGDNLAVLRESVGVTLTLAHGGARVLDAGAPLVADDGRLEVPLSSGDIPVDAVGAVGRELDQLSWSLPGPGDLTNSRFLVGPVEEVRERVITEVDTRREHFEILGRSLEIIADMSGGGGERRYLIAVANTAEMRGTGGMILSYGVLEGSGGNFDIAAWGRIDDLALSGPVSLDEAVVPADYLDRWAGFGPLSLWRNATMSPDFTITAPVLAAMYEQATGQGVDGIIHIDPAGLAAILEGTGPILVDEVGRVDSDNVVDLVLNRAYFDYVGIEERTDILTDVSEATFERLVTGSYRSLRPLVTALVETSEGRHIMAWSRSGRIQGHFTFFGVDGSLPPVDTNAYTLTVQNASANKLDYYVDSELRLEGDASDGGNLTATIDLSNTVLPGLTEPRYIVGHVDSDQPIGNYRGVVSLYVPQGTTVVTADGTDLVDGPVVQSEGGRTVIGFTVDVPAGARASVELELNLPPGLRAQGVLLIPTPRVRPTTVSVDADFGAGRVTADTTLDTTSVITVDA